MMREIVDWVAVGMRLRQIRKASRLSQNGFGKQFEVSQNMISLYEKGRSHPSVEFLVRVARLGNKTIEWLLLGHEDRNIETLRQMRDLYDRMTMSLSTVRQLIDREMDDVEAEQFLAINNSEVLRQVLSKMEGLPPCIQELLSHPMQWSELAMTGREFWAFRVLTRLFGDLDEQALWALLTVLRSDQFLAAGTVLISHNSRRP